MKCPKLLLSATIAAFASMQYAHSNVGDSIPLNQSDNWHYHNPAGDRYPIMAGGIAPDMSQVKSSDFERLAKCGFNMVEASFGKNDPYHIYDLSEGTGLLLNVRIPYDIIKSPARCVEYVNKWKDLPRVAMYDFGDEIKWEMLKDEVLPSYKEVRELRISQIPIFNRAVFSPRTINGSKRTVSDELNEIQDLFHPAVWCYDYYPVYQTYTYDNDHSKEKPLDKPYVNRGMYIWLECYRYMADRTNRPFWYYIQGMEFETRIKDKDGNYTGKALRRPMSEEFMRFSVFSSLAYGAKGLRWWAYSMQKPRETEWYFNAPIDLDDQPTDIWFATKNVISEVRRFNDLFLNSKVEHVYHSGKPEFYGTTKQPDCVGPFRSLTSGEKGVLTSLMTYDDKHYMMIVNHDILKPQKVKASAAEGIKVRNMTAGAKKFSSKSSYTFTLNPGGYVLLEYNRNDSEFRP